MWVRFLYYRRIMIWLTFRLFDEGWGSLVWNVFDFQFQYFWQFIAVLFYETLFCIKCFVTFTSSALFIIHNTKCSTSKIYLFPILRPTPIQCFIKVYLQFPVWLVTWLDTSLLQLKISLQINAVSFTLFVNRTIHYMSKKYEPKLNRNYFHF